MKQLTVPPEHVTYLFFTVILVAHYLPRIEGYHCKFCEEHREHGTTDAFTIHCNEAFDNRNDQLQCGHDCRVHCEVICTKGSISELDSLNCPGISIYADERKKEEDEDDSVAKLLIFAVVIPAVLLILCCGGLTAYYTSCCGLKKRHAMILPRDHYSSIASANASYEESVATEATSSLSSGEALGRTSSSGHKTV